MNDIEAARRVDAAARTVEGVTRLYSATPIPSRLARRITSPDDNAPLTLVDNDDDRLEVTVCIGVSALRAAATTAALVADAVRAEFGGAPASIHVRVSRVTAE